MKCLEFKSSKKRNSKQQNGEYDMTCTDGYSAVETNIMNLSS